MDSGAAFEERMRELREGFVAGLPARVEAMRAAVAGDDRETVQREAHRLAGTGLSYGLPELTTWGRAVERKCKAGEPLAALVADLEALAALIAGLTQPLDAVG